MNMVQTKHNIYISGEYRPDCSKAMAKEKAKVTIPTSAQVKYRDTIKAFCEEKGLLRESWKSRRTKGGISQEIRALLTMLRKNGLAEEFFARNENQNAEADDD